MDTCGEPFAYTPEDRRRLLEQGVSLELMTSIEHVCELEPEHQGAHVCGCGQSS